MMNGKGDKPRPTDLKKYRNNYDTIFSKEKEQIKRKVLTSVYIYISL